MTGFWNPVTADAIRKALGRDQVEAASESRVRRRMDDLDKAELQDLERAEYYGGGLVPIKDPPPATSPSRSILDRLLRR
jgi:hypothetical protein